MADSGKVPYVVIEKVTDYSQGMLISFFLYENHSY